MTAHFPLSANTVRLDPRRLAQLKAIADAVETTSAGVIAQWIRSCVDKGVIPPDIPGIVIENVPGGITIAIDGATPATLDFDMAGKIVAALRRAIKTGASTIEPFGSVGYGVVKKGPGIKFLLNFGRAGALEFDKAPSFPVDLAEDLADLIEKTAS